MDACWHSTLKQRRTVKLSRHGHCQTPRQRTKAPLYGSKHVLRQGYRHVHRCTALANVGIAIQVTVVWHKRNVIHTGSHMAQPMNDLPSVAGVVVVAIPIVTDDMLCRYWPCGPRAVAAGSN